ncbi:MAG: DUF3375 domain-containing protein [Planctomycetaceae bacterium]|nr:DUF3375 domain-containing protein [Planctomycetales bacterium]MCB9938670.1 DUF3375 domain-containing protein [Planctomycetaceae bacterium]
MAYFESSPAIRLFRSTHAPFVLCFLNEQFKQAGSITRTQSELVVALTAFQQSLREAGHEALIDRPESYLTNWATGETRWLNRFVAADQSEACYELTTHSEAAIKFVSDAMDRDLRFVGTESRLKRIIETLNDLVIGSSADPDTRLKHLHAEKQRIEDEIAAIHRDGVVPVYSPTAIRERFAVAVSDLTELQSDFRAVEEAFKAITRDVQRKQSESLGTRGDILGYALDAEDSLKQEDQGVSFDEFVRLILSPQRRDELQRTIEQLDDIHELASQLEGLRRVHGMIPSLVAEAQKVLRTTQRLSVTLRRLLDTRASAGRLRLANLLAEVRSLAVKLSEHPPTESVALELEENLAIAAVLERPFWSPPQRFESQQLHGDRANKQERLQAFQQLAALRRLDWRTMRNRVTRLLHEEDVVALPDLLRKHPPQSGAVEVLGYIQIAHDEGHEVDATITEVVTIPRDGTVAGCDLALDVPRVRFRKRFDKISDSITDRDP